MNIANSQNAFSEAQKYIPGGVNSPVRACKSVGTTPLFIQQAAGSYVTDIDGNTYLDYVASWGPMILGHAHPKVLNAVRKVAENGLSFGAPTELETLVAKQITQMMPSMELVRMVNSGTEATMSALRLARGYTQRDLVIKFEGCYHGHGDSFLINAGSGALTLGTPSSPGVTANTAKDTLTASFNDIETVKKLFTQYPAKIAAVIVEPVTGNMGVIPPKNDFLQDLRTVCSNENTLLIFDEVMTGFRVAKGGAQERYGITPDITTIGKIVGGGLPVGAYGGKKEIMERLSPLGDIYQAGTLSGNPVAMAAGYATLQEIDNNANFYDILEQKSAQLADGINENLQKLQFPALLHRVGSMFTLFFTKEKEINSFQDVMKSDTKLFSKYFYQSLQSGIYIAPSQFEAGFVSMAHTNKDIENTIKANYDGLSGLI